MSPVNSAGQQQNMVVPRMDDQLVTDMVMRTPDGAAIDTGDLPALHRYGRPP